MSSPCTVKFTKESVAATAMWAVAGCILGLLAWILIDIAIRGLPQLSIEFLIAEPKDAGRAGGIGPIIVSTLLILAVTLIIAVPLSLATAVALAERTHGESRFGRFVRRSLDALAAVPSIVFGLFGYVFFGQLLGTGFSILSGGLTLACMALPIMIRTIEQGIRAVPEDYRRAAAALGISRTTTLLRVQLPAAAPAVGAGLVLGIGRAIAETAALIYTSGYVARTPESLFDSGRALSVHIYDLAMNVPGGGDRAYATAAVLILLLLLINIVTAVLTRNPGHRPVARRGAAA